MEMFDSFTKEGIMPKPHNGRLISQEESDSIRQNIKDVKERKEDYTLIPLDQEGYNKRRSSEYEIDRSLKTQDKRRSLLESAKEEDRLTDIEYEELMSYQH